MSRNAGGLFFSVRSLAKSLVDQGTQCRVLGPHDNHTDADIGQWDHIPVETYRVKGPASLGYSPEIASKIGQPDIQHMHGIWMYHSKVNRATARKHSTPYLISPRGMLDRWAVENSGWKKKLAGHFYEYKHLKDACCIHALCESEARSIREFGLKNPICIIPNGVELPESIEANPQMANARKQMLFLGRIHPKKGLRELFHAWAKLDSTVQDEWEIVVAGWGTHQSELESLVADLGLSKNVRFVGSKYGQEKADTFRRCDAFVLPSFSEGLPMSVLEAWSWGKPTLITTACNLPEGRAAKATIECESGEQGVLSGLREFFHLSKTERDELGLRARQLAESRFGWARIACQMKEVYLWQLGRTDRPKTIWDL